MSAGRGSSHENPAGHWTGIECDLRVRIVLSTWIPVHDGEPAFLSLALYAIQLRRYGGSDWNLLRL